MSKFMGTPGEWYTPNKEYPYGRDVRARIGERDVWVFSAHGSHGQDGEGNFPTDEECAANALLAMSAPALLAALDVADEALTRAVAELGLTGEPQGWLRLASEDARAALALALPTEDRG